MIRDQNFTRYSILHPRNHLRQILSPKKFSYSGERSSPQSLHISFIRPLPIYSTLPVFCIDHQDNIIMHFLKDTSLMPVYTMIFLLSVQVRVSTYITRFLRLQSNSFRSGGSLRTCCLPVANQSPLLRTQKTVITS